MALDSKIKTIYWQDNFSRMIDQTALPKEFKYVDIKTGEEMVRAIKDMIVRGAPAIGVAGAQGVTLYAQDFQTKYENKSEFIKNLLEKTEVVRNARPTAVNLMWAVDKQKEIIINAEKDENVSIERLITLLKENADKILEEDIEMNKKMGDFGATIVPKGGGILTHCNAGALATGGYGTALGVIRSAFALDKTIKVFADETRPRLQGAKLTAYELLEDNIPVTLVSDGMCAFLMKNKKIDVVITGADRITANGDTANKIGTYTLAIAAKYHNIPFYIAAPTSTIDVSLESGESIPIEERSGEEITHVNGAPICPLGVNTFNPAFDVTPNELIAGIITERGILRPDYKKSIAELNL